MLVHQRVTVKGHQLWVKNQPMDPQAAAAGTIARAFSSFRYFWADGEAPGRNWTNPKYVKKSLDYPAW